MRTTLRTDPGTRVMRKRDGALGTITKRELLIPTVAHPGINGKSIVTIKFDAGGWDSTGDLGWLRSYFKSA